MPKCVPKKHHQSFLPYSRWQVSKFNNSHAYIYANLNLLSDDTPFKGMELSHPSAPPPGLPPAPRFSNVPLALGVPAGRRLGGWKGEGKSWVREDRWNCLVFVVKGSSLACLPFFYNEMRKEANWQTVFLLEKASIEVKFHGTPPGNFL